MSSTNQNGYQKLLAPPESAAPPLWSSGLSDCCSDASLCCVTCWCPCITFGRIAEAVDNGKTSCVASASIHALLTYATGCGWIYSFIYRSKIRAQYKLGDSPFKDCLAHFCCERCALCQEYRELQLRGSIMSNDCEERDGVEVAPVAPGGMIR